MDQDQEEEPKPTFRIRFTINQNSNQQAAATIDKLRSHSRDENHCDQKTYQECETHNCNHQIDAHHHHHHQATIDPIDSCEHQPNQKKKLFKFIKPQNHKSSLFVNLSDINSGNQQNNDNHLFISPDLNQITPATPPTPPEPTLCSSSFELGTDDNKQALPLTCAKGNPLSIDYLNEKDPINEDDDNDQHAGIMSQGCNFISSLMYTSRRRSSSVTQAAHFNIASNNSSNSNHERSSSSHDLAAPTRSLADSSASGNHLAVAASTETICSNEQIRTNRNIKNRGPTINNGYVQHSDMNMRPLEINIYPDDSQHYYKMQMNTNHPISLDDILKVDNLRIEDECKNLENQVEYWEQKVDDLERKRFGDDVPRTLVENVLKQRKRLRELEFQIYKLNLETEVSECRYHKLSLLPNVHPSFDTRRVVDLSTGGNLATGKFGSHIRPGQENTADILDAIPPSGSLQHKQYLSKASTATDSSEYTQLPTFDQHKHPLSIHGQQPMVVVSNDGELNKRVK